MAVPKARSSFRAFRHYNYRLYWGTMFLSMIGTWMQNTALAWLVLTLKSSAVALGVVNALQFLPSLVLSLFAGVLIERVPKKRVLLVTQSVEALQALVLWLLVWRGTASLWQVYGLSLLLGIANAFDQPARQAFVSEMVPEEDVTNAIGLNSMMFNGARALGPMVAGILIATAGLASSFLINAMSFLFVIAGFLLMRSRELRVFPPAADASWGDDLKEGFVFVTKTPLIAALLISLFFAGLFGYNFTTIIPLLAKFVLQGSSKTLGVLSSALGAGSLVGAFFMAGRPRPSLRLLYFSALLFSLCEVSMIFTHRYALIVVLLVLMGVAGMVYLISTNATLQLESPFRLRARVISLYILLLVGVTPIGAFITGYWADRWGTLPTIFVEGFLSLIGVFLSLAYLRQKKSSAPQIGVRS